LREKSSEDLYAKWAEYEGSAKTLNFGANADAPPLQTAAIAPTPPPVAEEPSQTPRQSASSVAPPEEETISVSKPELPIPDAREERVSDENVPPSQTSETRVVADMMRLMSFDHDDDANTGKPTGPPPPPPPPPADSPKPTERSAVEPIPNLIDL